MISVTIQCGCGQRYAFDVEPVDGRMPSAVACPSCGADGTAAANAVIAQSTPAQPTVTSARRVTALHPGQTDRTQAQHEAKAKISWGDPPQEVIKYLMMQGFSYEEASSLVQEMFQERAAEIRGNGIKKIIVGAGLICVPVITFLIFMSIGIIYFKILALTVMAGVWGLWMAAKGIFMVAAPKSEPGDVAEQ